MRIRIDRNFDSSDLFDDFSSFTQEAAWLRACGMEEGQILEFRDSIALSVYRSNKRYKAHNLPLYGQGDGEDGGNPDVFAYQRGADKKRDMSSKKEQTDWTSIRLIVVPLATEDDYQRDVYLEAWDIVEQLDNPGLQAAIREMPEKRQYILELMIDGWSQREIAQKLGVSDAAITKQVKKIREALKPFYREIYQVKITSG